jgi:essential nuclear protein 1
MTMMKSNRHTLTRKPRGKSSAWASLWRQRKTPSSRPCDRKTHQNPPLNLNREVDSDDEAAIPDDDDAWGDDDDQEVEQVEVDPQDLAMFNKFNPEFDPATLLAPQEEGGQQDDTNLADLILERIAQHEASQAQGRRIVGGGAPEDAIELPAKVVEVYTQ